MTTLLLVSDDDGHLYDPAKLPEIIGEPGYWRIEVQEPVTLTSAQLCASESLVEVLLQSGQAVRR